MRIRHSFVVVVRLVLRSECVCAAVLVELRAREGSKIVRRADTAQLVTDSEMMTESAPNSGRTVYAGCVKYVHKQVVM